MGDRANILVKEDGSDSGLWLYTHWNGSSLPHVLQAALKKKWRWDDTPYLARIIFCEMVKGDVEGETGFGISTRECDGGDRVLEVRVDEQTVNGVRLEEYIALSEIVLDQFL
jgi:hypothetical protein